ncbi:MAG: hypothetical protein HBSAPP03_19540 [Phycisphaerae bacterium]|nr:MAG: hypothetical protein HBSAPP03_19540 [Phycisphaerae bacterium]
MVDRMNEETLRSVFEQVPGRVNAALRTLEYLRQIENPCGMCEAARHPRDLTPREHAVYAVALGTIVRYLTGEVDMGGPPLSTAGVAPAGDPREPYGVRLDGPGLSGQDSA